MDTHPIQASPQRWIVALGLLLVAGVQGLFLWGYTDDGIWVSLLDGMAATLLFALSAYWAWYVLGFVHISITTLFITILGTSCTLVGSFFIRWILEFINHAVYTPFKPWLPMSGKAGTSGPCAWEGTRRDGPSWIMRSLPWLCSRKILI